MGEKRVGVLLGGIGPEREISLTTGEAVATALAQHEDLDVTKIYVDRDIDRVLRQTPIDVAFLALHGPYGEDGCIQGMLELMGVPYTGSDVLASALSMDKLKAKELFRLYNIPTPPYYVIDAGRLDKLEEVHGSFGYPVFVKPRRGGSSVGAGPARDFSELRQRCEEAAAFDQSILVERMVIGREVAVGLLNGDALGAIEVTPGADFYDYKSKYRSGESSYHFPARLTPTRYKGVLNIAERANLCLGVTGPSRVDMLVTEGENEYVLEVNSMPGLTPTSLLPKIAGGAGYDFPALCRAILDGASLGYANVMRSAETREEPPSESRRIAE